MPPNYSTSPAGFFPSSGPRLIAVRRSPRAWGWRFPTTQFPVFSAPDTSFSLNYGLGANERTQFTSVAPDGQSMSLQTVSADPSTASLFVVHRLSVDGVDLITAPVLASSLGALNLPSVSIRAGSQIHADLQDIGSYPSTLQLIFQGRRDVRAWYPFPRYQYPYPYVRVWREPPSFFPGRPVPVPPTNPTAPTPPPTPPANGVSGRSVGQIRYVPGRSPAQGQPVTPGYGITINPRPSNPFTPYLNPRPQPDTFDLPVSLAPNQKGALFYRSVPAAFHLEHIWMFPMPYDDAAHIDVTQFLVGSNSLVSPGNPEVLESYRVEFDRQYDITLPANAPIRLWLDSYRPIPVSATMRFVGHYL